MTKLKDELTRLHGEVGRLEASLRGSLVNWHLADIVGGARGRLADAVAHPDADTDMEKPAAPQPIAEIKPGDDVDAQLKTDLEAAKAKTDAADAKHLELLRQEQAKASASAEFVAAARRLRFRSLRTPLRRRTCAPTARLSQSTLRPATARADTRQRAALPRARRRKSPRPLLPKTRALAITGNAWRTACPPKQRLVFPAIP